MDRLVALCKRRGFIFPSSEIYGGINGFWDYGPLGVELKRNIKDAWWQDVVRRRDDIVGLDAAIIMNPKVWEASGHVGGFTDPMVDCKGCKTRFRADKLFWWHLGVSPWSSTGWDPLHSGAIEADDPESFSAFVIPEIKRFARKANVVSLKKDFEHAPTVRDDRTGFILLGPAKQVTHEVQFGPYTKMGFPGADRVPCPTCGAVGALTAPRKFNLMLKTSVGALEDSSSVAYLRPETAQGIFCNYKNVLDTSRVKVPFGIAQIGKAFRNEINPRNFTFRSREFEQMEIEFFCHESEADKWYQHWRKERFDWYVALGLRSSRLRLRDHAKEELAHYAAACADIEYEFPFGVCELEGVANRTNFDLDQHEKASGKDMHYFDEATKERFLPHVIEPSGGVDRAALAFLCEAYTEDTAPDENGKPQPRTLMRLHPRLAPVKVAVFPLVNREGMPDFARRLYDQVKGHLAAFHDDKGAIGRRYRRQDEAGTPFCVTVDGQTMADQTVTVRDRDSLRQDRIAADQVERYVRDRLHID
jgi:glycyl-tRNA synthetase